MTFDRRVGLLMDQEMYEKIEAIAKKENRSVAQVIRMLLEQQLEKKKGGK